MRNMRPKQAVLTFVFDVRIADLRDRPQSQKEMIRRLSRVMHTAGADFIRDNPDWFRSTLELEEE